MTREDIIAGLKRRVARAEAAGRLESYFGAYEHAGLMTELDIHYNGRSYQYRDYRYDQLADAVNYARLDRARTLEDSPPVAETAPPETANPPQGADGELMRELGITYKDRFFCVGNSRYDRLADAVACADRRAGRG